MSRPQAAPNTRDGSGLSLINQPTPRLRLPHADAANDDTTPLTLWSKDGGEDFKVLGAVHVDALHLEDLTAGRQELPHSRCPAFK